MSKSQKLNSKNNRYFIISGVSVMVIAAALVLGNNAFSKSTETAKTESKSQFTEQGDLVIPVKEISSKASFYPVTVDDTELEVLAVKASDGTIRTAFNTCQICYSSGRGYYEQKGDLLICQNCGNQFSVNDIEVLRGGCNPVPIFPEEKTVEEAHIIISNEFLREAKVIFTNWKTY